MEARCAAGLSQGEHLCGNLTWLWHQGILSGHFAEKQAAQLEEQAHGASCPSMPSLMDLQGDQPHPSPSWPPRS